MEAKPLGGRVAVVTGASSGIGAATCKAMAAAGARVAMGARRTDMLEEVKTAIEKDGGEAVYRKTDVTVRQEVKDLVSLAEAEFGPVDILVSNAGIVDYSLMKNLREDAWEKMVDVHCKGFLHCIGAVVDGMVKRKKGHIVAISSENGKMSFPGFAVYSGTKFFMEGVCRGLRQEVSSAGVKVTSIQPGDVDTAIYESSPDDKETIDLYGRFPNKGVAMDPADIGNAVVYALTQPDQVAVNEILIQHKQNPTP